MGLAQWLGVYREWKNLPARKTSRAALYTRRRVMARTKSSVSCYVHTDSGESGRLRRLSRQQQTEPQIETTMRRSCTFVRYLHEAAERAGWCHTRSVCKDGGHSTTALLWKAVVDCQSRDVQESLRLAGEKEPACGAMTTGLLSLLRLP